MTLLRPLCAVALLAFAVPASAQDVGGAWKVERDRVSLRVAKVGFPTRAAGVALVKTGEFSNKGEALDNYAQFESNDRAVFATAYAYLPTYADAALAAYATDRSISARFGADGLDQQASVAFAGRADGAIRQVFTGALDGKRITTAAAFARVGGWIVKLRATGPVDRTAEVTAALDALLAGTTTDRDALVFSARPLGIRSPCPALDAPAPKVVVDDKTGAALLLATFSGGSVIQPKDKAKSDVLIAFPAGGATEACVRGTMVFGEQRIDLLQPAGTADPAIVLAAIGDAGEVIAVEKLPAFSGYVVKRYRVGRVDVGARIDRLPTVSQFADWLSKPGTPELRIKASTTVKADGTTQVNIDPSSFK